MPLQGSKKTSKTEPKVISGRGFSDFGQSLISCNTIRVLLDFHGFRLPRGGQKTIKKRCRKRNVEKDGPKPIFSKNVKIEPKMGSDLDHEFSPNSPPRGLCSDLGPKGGKKEPKDAKRMPKDTKRRQKGTKRIQNSYEKKKTSRNDTETIYKSSSLSDSIPTTPCQGTVAGLPQASGYKYT